MYFLKKQNNSLRINIFVFTEQLDHIFKPQLHSTVLLPLSQFPRSSRIPGKFHFTLRSLSVLFLFLSSQVTETALAALAAWAAAAALVAVRAQRAATNLMGHATTLTVARSDLLG